MNLLDSASLIITPNGYKATKLYSVVPTDGSGDLTFGRTGNTATRVNSSGVIESVLADKPRLDYLGTTCPKLLMEPQRTNIYNYSQELDNAYWTKGQTTVTANAVTSPDGTTNADSLFETAVTSNFIVYKTFSATDATAYTISAFVKSNGRDYAYFYFLAVNSVFTDSKVWFNLSSGVVATTNAGITASIESYGNGWYRISATRTAAATSTGWVTMGISTADNTDTYAGSASVGLHVWGMQLEEGAFATSYIPTTSASVTRNVDTCSKATATALLGQTEGTIFVDFFVPKSDTEIFTLSKSSPLNLVRFRFLSGLFYGQTYVDGGAFNFNSSVVAGVAGSRAKLALAYKSGSIAFYYNATLIGSSSGTFSNLALDYIELAAQLTTPSVSNNNYNSIAVWKTRLTNAELATLTSI